MKTPDETTKPPDAEQYARVLLWHIAGMRADILELQMLVADTVAKQEGLLPESVLNRYRKLGAEQRERVYLEAIAVAGLRDIPMTPPDKGSPNHQ